VVRADLGARDAAILIVTLVEGILSLAKSSQDAQVLDSGARNIRSVVASFRAPARAEAPTREDRR
jgi:hypothetical protein